MPAVSQLDKENTLTAGKWSKKPVDKPAINIPITEINKYVKPSFTVYHDENVQQSAPQQFRSTNVLKEWKPAAVAKEYEAESSPLFLEEPYDPMVQPQYDKKAVYQGTVEFSFEELRAMKYMKSIKEEQKKEEESRKILQAEQELVEKEAKIYSMKEIIARQEEMLAKYRTDEQEPVTINQEHEPRVPPVQQHRQEVLEEDLQPSPATAASQPQVGSHSYHFKFYSLTEYYIIFTLIYFVLYSLFYILCFLYP